MLAALYNSFPMPKKPFSTNPFRLLAESWDFLFSQPALFHVLVWLLIVPGILLDLIDLYWPESSDASIQQIGMMGYGLAQFLLAFLFFWGYASVLLVGRRMVKSKAGRSRTSFKAVRRESLRTIIPLFFTGLLRAIITLEWMFLAAIPGLLFLLGSQECRATVSPLISALGVFANTGAIGFIDPILRQLPMRCGALLLTIPLLLPAVIYQIRTAFFAVVITAESLRYRDALHRSRNIVRGKTWRVPFVILVLALLLYVPSGILSFVVSLLQQTAAPSVVIVSAIADDIVYAIATLLFLLTLTAFYGKLSKEKGRVEEVVPEEA